MFKILIPNYEEHHKLFKDFKEDIERRLERWMKDHSEDVPQEQKFLPSGPHTVGPSWEAPHSKVEVRPSIDVDGAWSVFKGGSLLKTFFPAEHNNPWCSATSYANEVINGTA